MTDKQKEYAQRFYEKHPGYNKAYYETHKSIHPHIPKYTKEQRRSMDKTRWITNRYIQYHRIEKPCCQLCGNLKSQIHHPDYNNPWEVNFLCRKCHACVTWRKVKSPETINLKEYQHG